MQKRNTLFNFVPPLHNEKTSHFPALHLLKFPSLYLLHFPALYLLEFAVLYLLSNVPLRKG
jgi:hypothetical protein